MPTSRILPGHDYSLGGYGNSDARPGDARAHGMGCAGIIGASHTTDPASGFLSSSGMISINPNANIIPIKIFGDIPSEDSIHTTDDIVKAIRESYEVYGADILSCSWGWSDITIYHETIAEAIMNATLCGRDSLGCPVIFAAGNSSKPVGVRFPASAPASFSVGATQLDDYKWGYSSYGTGLDIVAPSGNTNYNGDVWTLDQMGFLGLNVGWDCPPTGNDLDYDCHFGGTSAAAPVVAGVASLILAKDPTLTAQQVYEILRESAVKDLDWGTIPDTPHVEYGYGRVDAFRAILSLSHGDVDNSGSVNNSPVIDIADLIYLIDYMFRNGPAPFPDELLGDIDCSGTVDVADQVYLVAFMFQYGAPPYPCFEF